MSDKRMFELEDEAKFWEIWADGTKVFTRFGKTGSAGQTKLKEEADADAAVTAIEKQVREKVVKGYLEVGGTAPKAPKLDAKELKRHLAALPPLVDDPGYLVFADWLQQQSHPWGELIVLQHGIATNAKKSAALAKEVDVLLKTQGTAILGELARAKHSHWVWHLGFLRRAVLGTAADAKSLAAGLKALLALPAAHMLEALILSPVPDSFTTYRDWGQSEQNLVDPWTDFEQLASAIPERIKHVGFGGWPAPAASAYVQMPSFAKLSKALPKLQRLELTGWCGDKPGKLSLSQLVELEVRFGRATGPALDAIATSKLPKLERLSVWLGGESHVVVDDVYPPDEWDEDNEDALRYPATYSAADLEMMDTHGVRGEVTEDELRGFLSASLSPSLVHLGLQSACLTAEHCTAIAKSPLVKRLKTLDLSGGTLDDDAIAPLIAAKKALAHLESIDVERNRLTAAGAKKLVAALPNAKTGKLEDKSREPDFHFRYVATVE